MKRLRICLLVALCGAILVPAAVRADPPPPAPPTLKISATYDVLAHIDWAHGTLAVDSTMVATNRSGHPVTRFALNTVAAKLGQMQLKAAKVDGVDVTLTVSGQTLMVPLPAPLAPDASTTVRIAYKSWFRHSTANGDWLWSQTGNVAQAYRWIPWISKRYPFKRSNYGDPFVTPVSPRVKVTFTSTRSLTFATSGRPVSSQTLSQSFVARNVRDFNFAASPDFHVTSGLSKDGQTKIRVFTRWGQSQVMFDTARRAVAAYESWIGQYPYPTLNVVQTPGGDAAMESPGMVWIPRSGFNTELAVAHEIAHQWFYATVGNDQVTDPWADEGMAEFLSRTLTGLLRSSRCSNDRFDRILFDYSRACYYEVIYIQGANFLNSLRLDMGNATFWGALKQYYAANRFKISSDKRLLQALRNAAGDWVLPRYHTRFPTLY